MTTFYQNTGKKVTIIKASKLLNSVIYAHQTYRELKLRIHLNHPDAQVNYLNICTLLVVLGFLLIIVDLTIV